MSGTQYFTSNIDKKHSKDLLSSRDVEDNSALLWNVILSSFKIPSVNGLADKLAKSFISTIKKNEMDAVLRLFSDFSLLKYSTEYQQVALNIMARFSVRKESKELILCCISNEHVLNFLNGKLKDRGFIIEEFPLWLYKLILCQFIEIIEDHHTRDYLISFVQHYITGDINKFNEELSEETKAIDNILRILRINADLLPEGKGELFNHRIQEDSYNAINKKVFNYKLSNHTTSQLISSCKIQKERIGKRLSMLSKYDCTINQIEYMACKVGYGLFGNTSNNSRLDEILMIELLIRASLNAMLLEKFSSLFNSIESINRASLNAMLLEKFSSLFNSIESINDMVEYMTERLSEYTSPTAISRIPFIGKEGKQLKFTAKLTSKAFYTIHNCIDESISR